MRKLKKYQILQVNNKHAHDRVVKIVNEEGWELLGAPFSHFGGSYGGTASGNSLCQALVMYEDDDKMDHRGNDETNRNTG